MRSSRRTRPSANKPRQYGSHSYRRTSVALKRGTAGQFRRARAELQTNLCGVEAPLAVRRQCESPGYDEAPRPNLRSVLTVFMHTPQVSVPVGQACKKVRPVGASTERTGARRL